MIYLENRSICHIIIKALKKPDSMADRYRNEPFLFECKCKARVISQPVQVFEKTPYRFRWECPECGWLHVFGPVILPFVPERRAII
jgi:hypothetical protein